MRAELLADGEGEDGVGEGDVDGADGVEGVPLPVGEGAVVEDYVRGFAEVDGAFSGVWVEGALPDAEVADDDVGFAAGGEFAALQADAGAGGGLAVDG